MLHNLLIEYIHEGNTEYVKSLFKNYSLDVNGVDYTGETVLRIALGYENHEIIKLVLGHPDLNVNSKCVFMGWTALLYASHKRFSSAVYLLLKHPDIDVNITDPDGMTALDYAVQFGYNEIVEFLLRHDCTNVNIEKYTIESLYGLNTTLLKMMCKRLGLRNYVKLSKNDIISMLISYNK